MSRTSPVDRAYDLLHRDIEGFQAALDQALAPLQSYVTDVEATLLRRGKKLRPLLLMMAARIAAGGDLESELPVRVYQGAASLELLHVATLVHDDIIDRAPRRRGLPSVNETRGADMALLMGDLLFVNGVRCFASAIQAQEDMFLVQMVLDVGMKICCGEIDELQTDPSWTPGRLRHQYDRTIDRKTAALFQLACESGASLVRSRKRAVFNLGRYGRLIGRAFQIMDDIGDFVLSDETAGKRRGTDLRARRATLPIINCMEEMGPDSLVSRLMRGEVEGDQHVRRAIRDVVGCSGFTQAYGAARQAAIKATDYLKLFPDGPIRSVLHDLAYDLVVLGRPAAGLLSQTPAPRLVPA